MVVGMVVHWAARWVCVKVDVKDSNWAEYLAERMVALGSGQVIVTCSEEQEKKIQKGSDGCVGMV